MALLNVPEPHHQYYLSLESPGYVTDSKKTQFLLENMMFVNLKTLEMQLFENVGKGERQ